MKKTKIVATISDQRCDIPFLTALFDAGVNVVRLNTAHMDREGFDRVIGNVRAVSSQVGILMDTKGPEVRTTACQEPIRIMTGKVVRIGCNPEESSVPSKLNVNYTGFYDDIVVGARVLIDDGEVQLRVDEKDEAAHELVCTALNDASIGSRKSVNVPGLRINLPSLTERDRRNIEYAIEHHVDFIAHSFVRNKQDVQDIQDILNQHHSTIRIIAKIENQEGVDHADEILEVAYGIMVARGDLGIEVPYEKIPAIQRTLINKCIEHKRPVIVATQMLHTMIHNPLPTRAEVTDVASAIYYHTDAVMLSGETAYGKYPIEAVQTMKRIIIEAENSMAETGTTAPNIKNEDITITSFLAKQAVKSIRKLGVKAIVTDSYSGRTARNLAAFRGVVPVYAICYTEELIRALSLCYGVLPEYHPAHEPQESIQVDFCSALQSLVERGLLCPEDRIAHMSGVMDEGGFTTSLEINSVAKISKQK